VLQTTLSGVLDKDPSRWRLVLLLLFGLRLLGGAWGACEGVASLANGYRWARTPEVALNEFPRWLLQDVFALPTEPAPDRPTPAQHLGQPATDPRTDGLAVWRHDRNYARPLLDDWGTENRDLPPAWDDLVTAEGGLSSFAVWGFQPWMVAADLALSGLGDIYLALGRADLDGSDGGADDAPSTAIATSAFTDVLKSLPVLKPVIVRLLERPAAEQADFPQLRREESPDDWPPATLPPPEILRPTLAAQLAALQRALPDGSTVEEVPKALRDVVSTRLTMRGCLERHRDGDGVANGGLGLSDGSGDLLSEWHARWA